MNCLLLGRLSTCKLFEWSISHLTALWSEVLNGGTTSTVEIISGSLTKTKSKILDNLVGEVTHCVKQLEATKSYSVLWQRSVQHNIACQSISGQLKSPCIMLGPVAGPRLWNNLPVEFRQRDICLTEFRRLLKTFLFC